EHLRRRYRAILAATGEVSLLLGALMLSPLVLLLARPEEARHAPAFLLPAAVLAAVGVMLRRQRLAGDAPLSRREAAVVVVAGWVLAAAAGAAPLVALEGLDVTRAVFESISGFTTTGLSVVDVEHARALTLLW